MPVIGSYRGCDSCRRWKKKCDSVQPGEPCSRCRTRNIQCVGVGQQRFKFKNQSLTSRGSSKLQSQEVVHRFVEAATRVPKSPLRSNNEIIASTLVRFLDSTHPGYNFNSFRPSLFGQLPKRIGHSVALDASLAAFTSILETQQSPLEQFNSRSRQLYASGLKLLQKSLAHPIARYHPNTICAAYILWECSVWVAYEADISRGHSEGFVRLINNIVRQDLSDPFLRGVCSAITVNLVQDAVFNPNIQLNPWIQELYDVPGKPLGSSLEIGNALSLPTCELGVLAMIPDLIRCPGENKERIKWTYSYILDQYVQVKVVITATEGTPLWDAYDGVVCNERQGFFISIGITLNAFLRTFYPKDMLLVNQRSIFCADAITLAERAKRERPLSAHHVPQAIVSAWCVTEDKTQKEKLQQLMDDYQATFAMAKLTKHISYWREAPGSLREIPRFTLCYDGNGDTESGSAANAGRGTEIINRGMQEYCCIL